jgi:hypothetical protein
MQKGWEAYGVDAAPSFPKLLVQNLALHHLPESTAARFSVISPNTCHLPFADAYFNFILSNQVLYYLPSEDHVRKVCSEFDRVLALNGIVFFTMMGPKNHYITKLTKNEQGGVHDVRIDQPGHRLNGVRELILLIRDADHLCSVFDRFEPITTGYFDQAMFDMTSNFHWIFAGKKR